MKFQNPFDLFNNYLDKSKNNIEPFDNEIEDVSNKNEDEEKSKKKFDYGIGFMILILSFLFVFQFCIYALVIKIGGNTTEKMEKILKDPFWNFPYIIGICFFNFIVLFLFSLPIMALKFGIKLSPFKGLNFYNLMFIVFILTSILLLGSHILFVFFPSFIEIFENTIGYSIISLAVFGTFIKTTKPSLTAVFGDRLKVKAFSSFNIGLEFLITYFTLSKFSESFLSFIQDVLSDGKNNNGEPVNSISQFSDFELLSRDEANVSADFINLINKRKREKENTNQNEPYDFTTDDTLKDHYNDDLNKINVFKKELFQYTLAKHTIGSFCWSYFISVIIFVGSINAFIT